MIIDGKAIAEEILKDVRERVGETEPIVRAIVMQPSAATESYLRIKQDRARAAGMYLEVIRVENDATSEDILAKIALPGADALIVQLPLPAHIATREILDAIPIALDADVLSSAARAAFSSGAEGALLPPVVAAVREILERAQVDPHGKRAVVVGQGWLVGEPVAEWLMQQGAVVETITRESGDLSLLAQASIVVSGAGAPGLITPELLAEGAVVIDAGTSESDGSIVGDADPACAKVASVFTPVPGGVGPIAVACLFKNAAELVERNRLQAS